MISKNNAGKTARNRTTKRKWGKTNVVLIFLLCLIACLIFFCHQDKTSPNKNTFRDDIPPFQKQESPAPEIIIQRIILQPSQPTKRDTVKAEVSLSDSAKASGKQFQYVYLWKVNKQRVSDAVGDTLQLSEFEIDDLVTVTVIPYDGGVAAPARTSPYVKIRAVPPSLDLHLTQDRFVPEKPFECRLISKHPDSETVTFALEDPKAAGMTIDAKTGLITWSVPTEPPKALEFGASVIDPAGNKTTKVFTLNLNPDSSAPASTD